MPKTFLQIIKFINSIVVRILRLTIFFFFFTKLNVVNNLRNVSYHLYPFRHVREKRSHQNLQKYGLGCRDP